MIRADGVGGGRLGPVLRRLGGLCSTFPTFCGMVRFAKAPPYYETEESSMKSKKIVSLLLTGAMTVPLESLTLTFSTLATA